MSAAEVSLSGSSAALVAPAAALGLVDERSPSVGVSRSSAGQRDGFSGIAAQAGRRMRR